VEPEIAVSELTAEEAPPAQEPADAATEPAPDLEPAAAVAEGSESE
jgi:hypothetical protein